MPRHRTNNRPHLDQPKTFRRNGEASYEHVAAHAEAIRFDTNMMKDSKLWPRFPILPLRRRTDKELSLRDSQALAIMLAGEGPTIYFANLHRLGIYGAKAGMPWSQLLRPFDKAVYESFEALAVDYKVD